MTGDVTLSLIVPTIGRPSLVRLIGEVLPQLGPDDELLIVGDGKQPEARKAADGLDPRVKYSEHGPTRNWGHSQRNWIMPQARGSHILFLDDDDRCAPKAFAEMRAELARRPDHPHLFRSLHPVWGHFWVTKEIRVGNVSTQQIVVPNVPARLGAWGDRYEGDFDFIRSTVALYPGRDADVIWCERVVSAYGCGRTAFPEPKFAGEP